MSYEKEDEQALAILHALPESQIRAMELILELADVIDKGDLSIEDIEAVVRLAVSSGHDIIEISLGMAAIAVGRAKEPPS